MELKKLALTLLAAFTLSASAVASVALPVTEQNRAIEKVPLPTIDDNTAPIARKCPPFC